MNASFASRLRRRRRPLLWLAGLFTAYSLAGFFVAPLIVKQQLVKQGTAALRRPVAVAQVRVNPWTFSATIRGLTVAAHDGAEFAGWDELHLNFAPATSLFRLAWSFDEIALTHPRARLYREPDGALNIADLLAPAAPAQPETRNPKLETLPPKPATAVPALAIAHLRVDRGEFTYADKARSAPFSTTFGPTSFELRNFTTQPNRSGAYTFAAATEAGEQFAWQGTLTFAPLGSAGRLAVTAINLPKYAAFHRDLHQLDVLSGRLGVALDYELDLAAATPVLRLRNGRVTIADLALAARGTTTPLATLPLVELTGLVADSAKQEASVATVLVRDADLSATRRADGTTDWLALLQPAAASSPVSATPPASTASTPSTKSTAATTPPFSATLGSLEIANATLRLHDLTTPRPVALTIDQFGLKLTGASTTLDRPVTVATALRWNGAGHIAVDGTVTPQPLAADLQVDVAEIALRPLDPYLAPFLDVLLTSGSARAKGHLTFALAADGAPDLRFTGDAGLAAFTAVDAEFSEPLLGFTDLAFLNLRATTQPLAIALDEVAVKEPFARAIVFADKRLNFTTILKNSASVAQASLPAISQPAGTETGATPASPPQPETPNPKPARPAAAALSPQASRLSPQITIARVTLSGGRFIATDRSVSPAFTTELTDFGGTISGLSSAQLARADVDLSGRLGLAPLKISGQINPLSGDAFTDLKVTFTGIELPTFTPYAGKFAGYTIDKGKLSLDLAYRLSARELIAENKVALDQFYLGQPVESPDAVKLPLKLALGLLRDREGRIPIDLPIRGNLDDPDFKYGNAVWRALGNLIVKAATAPFSLLGGLFGGGRDLSAVDFATGSAALDPEALARLDGLATALTERPGLTLEISSPPQRELDLAGLRAVQLDALLRARKLRELAATTTAAIDPATLQLTPEESTRFLAALHTERCPPATPSPSTNNLSPSTDHSAPFASRPSPRASSPNLVVRTVRRFFGGGTPASAPAAAGQRTASSAKATPPSVSTSQTPLAALTPEEHREQVLATLTPSDSAFADLAAERARRIHDYLLAKGGIDSARIFLAPAGVPPATGATPAPRVVFNLQ